MPSAKKGRGKLTKRQHSQRKYAAAMRTVRKRAKKTAGGRGRIAKRKTATTLRRRLGVRAGA